MDRGPCAGQGYSRWYFDYNTKTCKKFMYSGCPGNANMFDKEADCEKACGFLRGESSFPRMSDCVVVQSHSVFRASLLYSLPLFHFCYRGNFSRFNDETSIIPL